ncbi:TPA: thioredoxin family protein, partial [Bacillus cereus]|nr:thioredoxin family protein [Bacillus cereus]HDR7194946.1 thioredoxin family protein [Bacillus cereus]HDR7579054.1 thioredoxin family protein [Bacillus cereus]HDR8134901.1 thioredoxin family protein [Bacillus cereus]
MKKMLIFSIIVVCTMILFFLFQKEKFTNDKEVVKSQMSENESENYYSKQLTLDQLQTALQNKEEKIVYFYKPNCPYCEEVSPLIVPMAKKENLDLEVLNLDSYKEGWSHYKIEGTPTIVHYKGGKEVNRIVGATDENGYLEWFRS